MTQADLKAVFLAVVNAWEQRNFLAHRIHREVLFNIDMNGGDILTLQKALGHSDIKVTMRYAHLSPKHLEQVAHIVACWLANTR